MSNKKGFHLVITDNKSGKVLHDEYTDCIIGAFQHEKGSGGILSFNCALPTIFETLMGAEATVNRLYEHHPMLKALKQFADSQGIDPKPYREEITDL